MKKNILYSFILIFIISCGETQSSSSKKTINNSEIDSSTIINGTTSPNIDTSIPLTTQIEKIFSTLKPNSNFYNVKIKEVSHPKEFVGSWTMWRKLVGAIDTLNADGSCEEILYHYKKGEKTDNQCLKWYHITLEKENRSFLLFIHTNYTSIINYEWSGKDNLYLTYYNGDGELATRTSYSDLAKYIEERFLLGKWVQKNSDLKIFWTFGAKHKFLVQSYTTDNKLVIDRVGRWSIDKTKVTISIDTSQNSEPKGYLRRSLPPKEIKLNFLYGIERLGYASFARYSEPLMVTTDPYVGKFQAHSTYNSRNVISLNILKKEKNKYKVDIFWNNKYFPNNSAEKINENLYVQTEFGTIIFKAVINGIQKINYLENNSFNFPKRILKITQETKKKEINIIGKWVQSVHYSILEKYRYFTFLENGRFFHTNGSYHSLYDVKIGRGGTYRQEGDKLYLKPQCGKEEKVETIILNEAHFNTKAYGDTAFVKIQNSKALSSFWYALRAYEIDYKRSLVKLISDPKHAGKFLFSKDMVYSNLGQLSMHFSSNGEMFSHYSGLLPVIYQDYYIESKNGIETIVLLKSLTNIVTTKNPEPLKFYNARQTICENDSLELGLD